MTIDPILLGISVGFLMASSGAIGWYLGFNYGIKELSNEFVTRMINRK